MKKIDKNNIIKGVIELFDDDKKDDILLFNKKKVGLEVYLNIDKIDNNKIEYNKLKEGKKFNFKIKFNYCLKNFKCFFKNCINIVYLDFSNFDTSNVINMRCMFMGCKKLKEIKGINKFNTSKVTDMAGMFYECNELEYLDLPNFNTSNVIDIQLMSSGCHKLKEIKGIN